jgi:hypothetical protein
MFAVGAWRRCFSHAGIGCAQTREHTLKVLLGNDINARGSQFFVNVPPQIVHDFRGVGAGIAQASLRVGQVGIELLLG